MVSILLLLSCLLLSVRQQRHKAGQFDGISSFALMFRTELGAKIWSDLELGRHELAEQSALFVINYLDFFLAKETVHVRFAHRRHTRTRRRLTRKFPR